jgi:transposase-like protein
MNDRDRRIARARLLRRDGKTYDEIRAVIGPVDNSTLRVWVRGIARPPETYRTHRRDDLRQECRRLRAEGLTISEIAEKMGASVGSISPWVSRVKPRSTDRAKSRRLAGLRAAAKTNAARNARFREVQVRLASTAIGPLSDRELFLVGVALYWAEGSKSKPYSTRDRITFTNSDPTVIRLFVAWLQLLGVDTAQCRYRIQIHVTAHVQAAEQYWADLLGVPRERFSRATLKRHRPQTNRLNLGDDYHVCLVVTVMQSAALYRFVAGWWAGMHAQVSRSSARAAAWEGAAPWRAWRFFRRRLVE